MATRRKAIARRGRSAGKRALRRTAAPPTVVAKGPLAAGGRDAFDRYLSDLQDLPLLDASEEVELARAIERHVVGHWRALLSYGPARSIVYAAIEAAPGVSAPLAKLARTQARANAGGAAEVAQKLRRLDRDSTALLAADEAVRVAFDGQPRASSYLDRVARAREAQLEAKSCFVRANLRLVIALARRYDRTLLPLADLIQEGNLGLMRAVERFDPGRGFRFSTYAAWWIRHALNRALSNKGRMVRLPVHALDDVSRIRRTIAASRTQTGTEPSERDLAASTGMPLEKVALLQAYSRTAEPASLDMQLGDDRDRTLHDVLPAQGASDLDHALDLEHWRGELGELLSGLSGIEAATLRLRFGLDGAEEHTLRDIGDKYNLSRERIRQIQGEALRKLRDALRLKRRKHDERDLAA